MNTRRKFLQSAGVSAATLPFLQNLAACAPATAGKPRQRLVVMFSPNGVIGTIPVQNTHAARRVR